MPDALGPGGKHAQKKTTTDTAADDADDVAVVVTTFARSIVVCVVIIVDIEKKKSHPPGSLGSGARRQLDREWPSSAHLLRAWSITTAVWLNAVIPPTA